MFQAYSRTCLNCCRKPIVRKLYENSFCNKETTSLSYYIQFFVTCSLTTPNFSILTPDGTVQLSKWIIYAALSKLFYYYIWCTKKSSTKYSWVFALFSITKDWKFINTSVFAFFLHPVYSVVHFFNTWF